MMKILLVDDHPVFRSGMAVLMKTLFADVDINEVGDVSRLKGYIESDQQFDLLLLDLMFPGFDPDRDFNSLRNAMPTTPIVAVSMTHDDGLIDRIMHAGANGFVSKAIQPGQMAAAFKAVMDGEIIVKRANSPVPDTARADPMAALTGRQVDVLRLIGRGLSNKEIARELDLSPFTVRTHVSALLNTLDLTSRTAAASFAASRGFV